MALKTDYKDDILDVSQNTKRKYTMIENQDGTVSFDDETVYSQEGDSFGASDINATNGKVNTLERDIGEINDNLTGLFTHYEKIGEVRGQSQNPAPYTSFLIDYSKYKEIILVMKISAVPVVTTLPTSLFIELAEVLAIKVDNQQYACAKYIDATHIGIGCMGQTNNKGIVYGIY